MAAHPLIGLSEQETVTARNVILGQQSGAVVDFREIWLKEPPKEELLQFLELEHTKKLSDQSARPHRLAKCQFDVVGQDKIPRFHEAIVNVTLEELATDEIISTAHHASLTL